MMGSEWGSESAVEEGGRFRTSVGFFFSMVGYDGGGRGVVN